MDDMATLRLQAHFMCNNVRWDKSGRFVCSWVDVSRDMDHGYVMWSFTGEMLYRYVLVLLSEKTCMLFLLAWFGLIMHHTDIVGRQSSGTDSFVWTGQVAWAFTYVFVPDAYTVIYYTAERSCFHTTDFHCEELCLVRCIRNRTYQG